MASVSVSVVVDRPRSQVFDWVTDWHNTMRYVVGMTRYQPTGDIEVGLGATFDLAVKVGPVTQESTIEFTEFTPGEGFRYEPRSGFKQGAAFTFTDVHDGGTEVHMAVDYELPGGLAGRMMGKAFEPAAKLTAQQSLSQLKEQCEADG